MWLDTNQTRRTSTKSSDEDYTESWKENVYPGNAQRTKNFNLLNMRRFFRFVLIFTILNNLDCPEQLLGIFKFRRSVRSRELLDETLLDLPKVETRMGQTMFAYAGAKDWNSLSVHILQLSTIAIFKQTLFKYLLDCDNHNHVCSL